MEQTVELWQMLEARERRAARQKELLARYRRPLVWFTMNIAGPVKTSPLIRRGFAAGCALLEGQLARAKAPCLHREEYHECTGDEACFVADLDPAALKRLTVELEEHCAFGRLFDMDVLTPFGEKVERETLGLGERHCLICGGSARACARSRAHTVEELQRKTIQLLQEALDERDAQKAAELACRALLYEVGTTPKPGLVDRLNSGSHRDMDFFTFMDSAAALWPYFEECARVGQRTAAAPPEDTFAALRGPARLAENAMLRATGGVNTHKGAIFTVGTLCGALGRLPREAWREPETVLSQAAAMTEGLVERELAGLTEDGARTTGQKLYLCHGITGVRGQLEAGLPVVKNVGLPVLERGLGLGKSLNDAGCAALLAMLAATVDTNLIARGGLSAQRERAVQVSRLLEQEPYPDTGPYIISSATFPSYFLKEENAVIRGHALLDLAIFTQIAHTLDISCRYVGEEPTSRVTGLYNEVMERELPKAGIECRVIPRLELEGEPVSASTVRRVLRDGDWAGLRRLVPPATCDYFTSEEASPVLERIRRTGDVAHY